MLPLPYRCPRPGESPGGFVSALPLSFFRSPGVLVAFFVGVLGCSSGVPPVPSDQEPPPAAGVPPPPPPQDPLGAPSPNPPLAAGSAAPSDSPPPLAPSGTLAVPLLDVPPGPSLPAKRLARSVAKGITLAFPAAWNENTPSPPPPLPKGGTFTTWGGKDPVLDGAGSLIVMEWTSPEEQEPRGTITSSYKGNGKEAPRFRFKSLVEPVCSPVSTGTLCSVPLVNQDDGSGLYRVFVFRGKSIVQIDLMTPPKLGEGMMKHYLEVFRTLKVEG